MIVESIQDCLLSALIVTIGSCVHDMEPWVNTDLDTGTRQK